MKYDRPVNYRCNLQMFHESFKLRTKLSCKIIGILPSWLSSKSTTFKYWKFLSVYVQLKFFLTEWIAVKIKYLLRISFVILYATQYHPRQQVKKKYKSIKEER